MPSNRSRASVASRLGLCQWFHFEDNETVTATAELLRELGVRKLRTGISWADFHRPGGREWYVWQMRELADFEVLLSVWHTPPSRAESAHCNAPPRRLHDYADFIEQVIQEFGDSFEALELWNEPNNRLKWDFERFDPLWQKFGRMVGEAGRRAQRQGVTTVLGGIIPVDHHWIRLMKRYGVLDAVDAVAIHGFPGMWWWGDICWEWRRDWHGWQQKIDSIAGEVNGLPIWITETGLATWDLERNRPDRFDEQCQRLLSAAAAPSDRVYWYCARDLAPHREAIEGFHVDENEYHLGLVTHDGKRKPAFDSFARLMSMSDNAAGRPTADRALSSGASRYE